MSFRESFGGLGKLVGKILFRWVHENDVESRI
jgi:hypothetical protein